MVYCRKCGNPIPDGALYCPNCGTPVATQEIPPAQVPPQTRPTYEAPIAPTLKLATWGERFVAWLIDIIIVGIFVAILSAFSLMWAPSPFWPSWNPLFNVSSGGIIFFLYWTIMEGAYGQSLGKMIMHLRVTQLDGSRISFGAAALESVGKAFLLLLDLLLGWILYPRRRQRIFNYISETVVIRE